MKDKSDKYDLTKYFFNAIQDGISILDTDFNIVKVNNWMNKLYLSNIPLAGKKCFKVYHGRNSICPWCPTLKALKTGKKHINTVPYTYKNNFIGWLELSAYPMKDNKNKVIGIIEHVKDITGKKHSEDMMKLQHLLSLKLSSTSDLKKALKEILKIILQIDCVDSGGIYLHDREKNELNLLVYKGFSRNFVKEVSSFSKHSYEMKLVKKAKPVYKNYVKILPDVSEAKKNEKLKALAIVPIVFNNELIGVLNIASHVHYDIPVYVRKTLESIASQIGSGYEWNSYLLQ